MIEKMDMKSMDITEENVKKIQALFPNAVTEVIVDGKTTLKIDFDVLKQELSASLIEDKQERYQMTWPDKSKAKVLANSRITSTLRPDKAKSVDFDNTQNLYIEGDNLDVLKLLRETYLGKVKMIYIDPPYNTGNDFVYNDDFSQSSEEYMETSGQYDEEGNRLVKNLESNGRFHTDWLNMIYPRLKVAKDLLSDDGLIFISMNDKEIHNLKKVCAEIFGGRNEIATLIWDKNHSAQAGIYKVYHEYIVVYSKNINNITRPASLDNDIFEAGALKKVSGRHPATEFTFPAGTRFDAPDGTIIEGEYGDAEKVVVTKGRLVAKDKKLAEEVTLLAGFTQANQMRQFFYGNKEELVDSQGQKIVEFYFNSTGKIKVVKQRGVETPQTTCKFGTQSNASNELASLFDLTECPFSSPKPVIMLTDFIKRFTQEGDIIMDFFSGSATTAHAVMEVNAEQNRKLQFILVQLPEDLDQSLKNAQKDAVRTLQVAIELLDSIGKPHTICEIGEERIRRAGAYLKDKYADSIFDYGFRVLKLDSSNMQDVYYNPMAMRQSLLDETIDNVKTDRTPLDLLFQVMLDLGVELSAKIEEKQVNGKTYFVVNGNDLIACFDEDIDNGVITEIAKQQPLYAVFKSTSFATDSASINNEQLFKTYSPATVIKVL